MSTDFDEGRHPRGPAGQFAAKQTAEAGVELDAPAGQPEPDRTSGGLDYFRSAVDRAEGEQAHAEWVARGVRLKVAKAAAEEVSLRYPEADTMVTSAHWGQGSYGPPRRLFEVRDASGNKLWEFSPVRSDDSAMHEVSDAVQRHDALGGVRYREELNTGRNLRNHVVKISDVHERHAEHMTKEPRR